MGKDIAEVKRNLGISLPEAPTFMEEDQIMGMEQVAKKVRPPFLKIVQKQSSDELLSEFGMGAAILVPDRIPILEPGGAAVRIVPLFFFSEFLKFSPIALKDQEAMIAERSLDPKSNIARRCATKSLWFEDHPQYPGNPEYRYRYAEALNFMCVFQEPHLQIGMPFTLSFSKGSYGKGQKMCNQLNMRKKPIFGCVLALSIDPTLGKNAKGEWRRFLIENPSENPWVVDPQEYAIYRDMHVKMKEMLAANTLETAYDEEEVTQAETDNEFA